MKDTGYVPRQRYAILAYWPWVRPGVSTTFLTGKTRTSDRQLRRDLRNVPSIVCIPDGRFNHYFRRERDIPCIRLPHSPLAPLSMALVQTELCYTIETGTTMQAVTDIAPVAGWSVRETNTGTRISTGGPVTFQIDSGRMLVCSDEPALLPEFAEVLKNAFACYESANLVAAALSRTPEPGRLTRDEWTSAVFGTGPVTAVRDACLPYTGGDSTLFLPSQNDRPAFFLSADADRAWLTTTAARERQVGEALGISTGAASAFLASFAIWARSGYHQTVSRGTVVEGLLARGTRPCTGSDLDAYVQELETAGLCRREKDHTLRFTPEGIRLGRHIGSRERCA